MKYFFDIEFSESDENIDLIRIGIVSEDGREYFACNSEYDFNNSNLWVKQNLVPFLPEKVSPTDLIVSVFRREESSRWWKTKAQICQEVAEFIFDNNPELWLYDAKDLDAFLQVFGSRLSALLKDFPRSCQELQQEADRMGFSMLRLEVCIPREYDDSYNADARWCRDAWIYLSKEESRNC